MPSYAPSKSGRSRVRNDIAGHVVIIGQDALPDLSSSGTLHQVIPFDVVLTLPVSGTRTHNILVLKQNEFGLRSQNQFPHSITIDSSGNLSLPVILAPVGLILRPGFAGMINVRAQYPNYRTDSSPATRWKVWVDTTAPDPLSDPMTSDAAVTSEMLAGLLVGPYAAGEYHVALCLYRESDAYLSDPVRGTVVIPVFPPDEVTAVRSGFDL